jgi:hypothetical protein
MFSEDVIDRGEPRSAPINQQRLNIIIEVELIRMGTERYGIQLVLLLVINPGIDQVGSEYAAGLQEGIVFLQCPEDFSQ